MPHQKEDPYGKIYRNMFNRFTSSNNDSITVSNVGDPNLFKVNEGRTIDHIRSLQQRVEELHTKMIELSNRLETVENRLNDEKCD